MAVGDPIADLLTRIRNGGMAQLRYVEVPLSKLKLEIVKVLKEQGFVDGFLVKEAPQGKIRIYLKYGAKRRHIIQGLERISRQSCRRYGAHDQIPKIFGGMGIAVVSTSRGVMIGTDAYKQKVGGELLCKVW